MRLPGVHVNTQRGAFSTGTLIENTTRPTRRCKTILLCPLGLRWLVRVCSFIVCWRCTQSAAFVCAVVCGSLCKSTAGIESQWNVKSVWSLDIRVNSEHAETDECRCKCAVSVVSPIRTPSVVGSEKCVKADGNGRVFNRFPFPTPPAGPLQDLSKDEETHLLHSFPPSHWRHLDTTTFIFLLSLYFFRNEKDDTFPLPRLLLPFGRRFAYRIGAALLICIRPIKYEKYSFLSMGVMMALISAA